MECSANGRPRVGAIKMSQEAHNQPLVTRNTNKKQVCAAGRHQVLGSVTIYNLVYPDFYALLSILKG